ncbi:uncharacterized protein LOC110627328 isoform X1 [Manihot esculenta]|uniref:Uncharacterized protein n=1 Tax=Manihot esculenta TaxID=3983 RepID=A0ACB7GPG8_MANES|nr:uncharacterized protein LOC110627328 isoform X1 [Manihot esculenta]KAG8641841.1 hypothetical protein MANES_12G037600v8 [Manihot esculenta]
MFGCKCFHRKRIDNCLPSEPDSFSLPAPLPDWPSGQGFASGRINLGEIEVVRVSRFELIWTCNLSQDKKTGVSFYKPVGVRDGFYSLGHFCQFNNKPFRGFLLVAREVAFAETQGANFGRPVNSPALQKPLDYTLIWSSYDGSEENYDGCGFFWLPQPPRGYKPLGFLVTEKPEKPDADEVRCVREDLTDECQAYRPILTSYTKLSTFPFQVWSTRPCHRGMLGRGVSVGTFFCSNHWSCGEELSIACLRNTNPELHSMPNLEQIHALINHYGPRVFFHPDEIYLPSSVSWFFKNGALLYKAGNLTGEPIDISGSNLPVGGTNDRAFWIDLPNDDRRDTVKLGNLESAKLYVHVKPAHGGTFTDIAMWVFCPFNGPATLKVGPVNVALSKIGQHVCDWEHFTLRICNFIGELWSLYFSQHSGGEWVEAYDLEYIEENKPIVYSSKSGHASYPHPGTYIQGSAKLGIGIRNDAARSNLYVDSSTNYEIVAAEYIQGNACIEPSWLQYMREWGPKIVYNSKNELDRIINFLPVRLRFSAHNIFYKLPLELYGEEGPTGPKEKNNWVGDERG